MLEGKRIVYLGDWVFYIGPQFIESPFEMIAKDCQLKFLGHPVVDALEKSGATVKSYSNWDLYHFSPQEYEDILESHDVFILSDVEARCFHLNPSFFDKAKHDQKVIVFPDKLRQLTRQIEAGKGLMYLGGWLSFSGHMAKGGWGRCTVTDWLPFTCLPGEDLVESSEGYRVEAVAPQHPILEGIGSPEFPPLLGYNEYGPKPHLQPLLRIRETGDPLLGVTEVGAGRMAVYGSDPVAHWGLNLQHWDHYDQFWQQMAHWVSG